MRCFFDITINNVDTGRVVFELFHDQTPKTCENFRQLCTGEAGISEISKKPLYYKGIIFHRVVSGFMVQSGDFVNSNGTGGESIYGRVFDDENLTLKHDKPFLLSMANRGKDTNSSQFFITTAPATHLDGIHTVFGRVVSGMDIVRQIESLPVDRNSRPLDEVQVKNCGELVKQVKEKKEKKKKKKAEVSSSSSESKSESSSSSSSEEEEKSKKKKQKKKKSKNDSKKKDYNSSIEEGELESDTEVVNPLISVTKIDPKEIPEVTNKFLMRSEVSRERGDNNRERDNDRNRSERSFGWSKKRVPQSRSGRIIKGRGNFRYRTPTRSRSRSFTPEHWKVAQRNLIKMTDYEKKEEEKKAKEEEIRRRAEERKKRHEAIAKGDGKKSFYELSHDVAVRTVEIHPKEVETATSPNDELDYEADEAVDNNEVEKKKEEVKIKESKKRSRSHSRDINRRRDYRDRDRRYDDRRYNRYDNRSRRTNDRDRDRRRSRSRSRSRDRRRRSYDRNSSRKKSESRDKKSLSKKADDDRPKMSEMNEKDIEDLQRRVNEAKRVLEIIVKEKEEELEKEKQAKRSVSPDKKKQRRSRKYSDSSN